MLTAMPTLGQLAPRLAARRRLPGKTVSGRGLDASKLICPQAVVQRRYQRIAENTDTRKDRFDWFAEKHASNGNRTLNAALLGIRDFFVNQQGWSVGKTLARRGKSQGFVC
jgi:hypothetical protein